MKMNRPNIGFIGFGEAAFHICEGLQKEGNVAVWSYDVQVDHPVAGKLIKERAKATNVTLVNSLKELIDNSGIILCATSAKYAVSIAEEASAYMDESKYYIELNSTSPAVKEEISLIIEKVKGKFVDGAILGAVPTEKHKVPIVVSGNGASDIASEMNQYNMNITYLNDMPGSASAIKMCRSIFMKGFTALMIEMLLASQSYGIDEKVLKSIENTISHKPLEEVVNLLVTRAAIHAERRVSEMGEVLKTLTELNSPSKMSKQTMEVYQFIVDKNLKETFNHVAPDDYHEVLKALDTSHVKS
ncbi:hypothetical protein CIL05_00170 [Virgibacillus profundi]|uniref:6-phosphogluconate dehydrogenase n=1 Tax=Virgibacillus profundi TaxID=2024555 RepID=A0A2A2IIX9_9BACI|nr:DUF1932 domain-containing protein [Virgibacillus profundi]PAV31110.1 hypothetical protein CIL05_00170 [Virgibacillus profundi]PXY55293.1 NAD(P)-dependent oxidoreductase [Virgibacillus profundi]